MLYIFFFSSRRRHTRCALVTGVQTCALPIWTLRADRQRAHVRPLGFSRSEQPAPLSAKPVPAVLKESDLATAGHAAAAGARGGDRRPARGRPGRGTRG